MLVTGASHGRCRLVGDVCIDAQFGQELDQVFVIAPLELELLGEGLVVADVNIVDIPHHDGQLLGS